MSSQLVIADVDSRLLSGKFLPTFSWPSKAFIHSTPFYLILTSFRGINEGRQAAREVDLYLEQNTNLPVTGGIVKRTAQEVFKTVAPVSAA